MMVIVSRVFQGRRNGHLYANVMKLLMAKSPPKPVEIYGTPVKMVGDEFHINSCRNFIPSTEWKKASEKIIISSKSEDWLDRKFCCFVWCRKKFDKPVDLWEND